MFFRSQNKGLAPQTPENDENDENGGCHSGKGMVQTKPGFLFLERGSWVVAIGLSKIEGQAGLCWCYMRAHARHRWRGGAALQATATDLVPVTADTKVDIQVKAVMQQHPI